MGEEDPVGLINSVPRLPRGREGKDNGRQRCPIAQDQAIIRNRSSTLEVPWKQIGVAIIGTGWCGGIRAETCAAHPLTKSLHLAEILPERLAEVAKATGAKSAVADYRELLKIPEGRGRVHLGDPRNHAFSIARDSLAAGKHVFSRSPSRWRSRRPTS